MVINVTDAEFQTSVLDSETPVLVDFWAEWCVPCHMIASDIEEISEERDDVKVVKFNVDENPAAMKEYGVMSIPTLILFTAGKESARIVGSRSKDAILGGLGLQEV